MDRIDVRGLGSEPTPYVWTGPAAELGLSAEPEFVHPVTVSVHARLVGSRVLLAGTAQTRLRLSCSRCLEPFDSILTADVDVECRPGSPPAPGSGEEDEADADIAWFEPPWIDAGEEVRQILLLAVPGYPVCREECRGLCPACGANRNLADCGHQAGGGAVRIMIQPKERN